MASRSPVDRFARARDFAAALSGETAAVSGEATVLIARDGLRPWVAPLLVAIVALFAWKFGRDDGPRFERIAVLPMDNGTRDTSQTCFADGMTREVIAVLTDAGVRVLGHRANLLESLETDQPSGKLVATFPRKKDTYCAIPVVMGNHWIMTVPSIPGVVSLDISDPEHPHEVSRITLDSTDIPHWIALEPNGRRVVITGYGTLEHRVLLATFDSTTGALGSMRDSGRRMRRGPASR